MRQSFKGRIVALSPRQQLSYGCLAIIILTTCIFYGLGAGSWLLRPYLSPTPGPTTVIIPPMLPATPTQEPPATMELPASTLLATPTQAPLPTRAPTDTPTPGADTTLTPEATTSGTPSLTETLLTETPTIAPTETPTPLKETLWPKPTKPKPTKISPSATPEI